MNAAPVIMEFDRYTNKYELVPDNISEKEVKAEAIRRNAKHGFSTSLGESPYRTKIQNVVGFGESKIRQWPRDPVTSELIDD